MRCPECNGDDTLVAFESSITWPREEAIAVPAKCLKCLEAFVLTFTLHGFRRVRGSEPITRVQWDAIAAAEADRAVAEADERIKGDARGGSRPDKD